MFSSDKHCNIDDRLGRLFLKVCANVHCLYGCCKCLISILGMGVKMPDEYFGEIQLGTDNLVAVFFVLKKTSSHQPPV